MNGLEQALNKLFTENVSDSGAKLLKQCSNVFDSLVFTSEDLLDKDLELEIRRAVGYIASIPYNDNASEEVLKASAETFETNLHNLARSIRFLLKPENGAPSNVSKSSADLMLQMIDIERKIIALAETKGKLDEDELEKVTEHKEFLDQMENRIKELRKEVESKQG